MSWLLNILCYKLSLFPCHFSWYFTTLFSQIVWLCLWYWFSFFSLFCAELMICDCWCWFSLLEQKKILGSLLIPFFMLLSQTIATVCMFLAGKVEETPRPLKDVIFVSYEIINKKDPGAAQKIKQKVFIILHCYSTFSDLLSPFR